MSTVGVLVIIGAFLWRALADREGFPEILGCNLNGKNLSVVICAHCESRLELKCIAIPPEDQAAIRLQNQKSICAYLSSRDLRVRNLTWGCFTLVVTLFFLLIYLIYRAFRIRSSGYAPDSEIL